MTIGRTRRWPILFFSLLLASIAGVVGQQQWQRFKQEQGIERLECKGWEFSLKGLRLQQFNIEMHNDSGQLKLAAHDVQVSLDKLLNPLPVQGLRISDLSIAWFPEAKLDQSSPPTTLPSRQDLESWLGWMPRQIMIEALQLELPCATGICREKGSLQWQQSTSEALPVSLEIQIQHDKHLLHLSASARQITDKVELSLHLALDGNNRIKSRQWLASEADKLAWNGTLGLTELPEAPWLLNWLNPWLTYELSSLPASPEAMHLQTSWALQLSPADLKQIHGEFSTSLYLPVPWPIPGLGQVQGNLDITLASRMNSWLPISGSSDLNIKPQPELFKTLPTELRPERLKIKITPIANSGTQSPLSFKLDLLSQGKSELGLQSPYMQISISPFIVKMEKTRVTFKVPQLSVAGTAFKSIQTNLQLEGKLDATHASIRTLSGSTATLQEIKPIDVQGSAKQILVSLNNLNFNGHLLNNQLINYDLQGPLKLKLGSLYHSQLHSRAWQWQGQIKLDSRQLDLNGKLANDVNLKFTTHLNKNFTGSLIFDGTLEPIQLNTGNPITQTLSNWPKLLELNSGRIQARGRFELPPGKQVKATLYLESQGLSGIYDRIELNQLNSNLVLALQNQRLQVDLDGFRLEQANPGLRFGPVILQGQYQAKLDQPLAGQLDIRKAHAEVLGGEIWAERGLLNLAVSKQTQAIHVKGLDLAQLLLAYPAEGLQGSGLIDGSFQLQLENRNVSIEQGSLAARNPGVLSIKSPRLQALGKSNPAMQLVTQALENFHYDLLASDIRYDKHGKLQLGLRLYGRNPSLERGRPINFNINLEENIPDLLTSLQLSDRVSETIQQRVREQLESDKQPTQP
ncbi:YdbH domain-containing protein [Azomonas macrocytogenes]|uniref:Dicarboxylate transport domain-containing protein n=1 Tax=Azomonas macrocytogenes TaxID=69962 RepID=A0A839T749_AZOMA|nr:YdbH domain-containing protein [Azomonas macrocytogenes]MBB3104918.1 hypothetical protein [Azomonas macrocytogenes]